MNMDRRVGHLPSNSFSHVSFIITPIWPYIFFLFTLNKETHVANINFFRLHKWKKQLHARVALNTKKIISTMQGGRRDTRVVNSIPWRDMCIPFLSFKSDYLLTSSAVLHPNSQSIEDLQPQSLSPFFGDTMLNQASHLSVDSIQLNPWNIYGNYFRNWELLDNVYITCVGPCIS